MEWYPDGDYMFQDDGGPCHWSKAIDDAQDEPWNSLIALIAFSSKYLMVTQTTLIAYPQQTSLFECFCHIFLDLLIDFNKISRTQKLTNNDFRRSSQVFGILLLHNYTKQEILF